jgi:hypothetical protein
VILSFSDIMPNRSYSLAKGASGAFIRRTIRLEANLNVKREMIESFGKPGTPLRKLTNEQPAENTLLRLFSGDSLCRAEQREPLPFYLPKKS